MILAILIHKSSRCFLPIFISIGPLVQENMRKKKVSRWPPWWTSYITDQNNLSYFRSTSHPNAFNQVWSQLALSSGEEANIGFSRWLSWQPSWIYDLDDFSHFFYLQVTPMLPIKFKVNQPFGSGE